MDEQIRIEETAHFYTEKKDLVDAYGREKEKQGYKVTIKPAEPNGWIVKSHIWLAIGDKKGTDKS